jgi:uncharacterized protein YjbJ (UPF0337 family)
MGFGLDIKVDVPKVPIPKVDVAAAVNSAKSSATGAVDSAKSAASDAVNSAKNKVSDTIGSVTDAVSGAVETAKASLSTVAGAISEVAVSFTGAIEDFVLEPHAILDANASYEKTKFEMGPIWIRVDHTPDEANVSTANLHLFCTSGKYDEKQMISSFTKDSGTTVAVLFENAPMNEHFSLEIIPADSAPITIFTEVSYGDLRKTKQRYL